MSLLKFVGAKRPLNGGGKVYSMKRGGRCGF